MHKLAVSKKVAAVFVLFSLFASSMVSFKSVNAVADNASFISEKNQDTSLLIMTVDVSDDLNSSPSPSPSPSQSPSPSPPPASEPSSTTTLVAFVVSAAIIVIGLALYFRKRNH